MTDTTKTVLIVAGAGVGVFVLLKLVAPPPLPRTPQQTTIGTLQGLAALGSSIKGLFGGSSPTSSQLSPGDRAIFDTVTDKSTGAVDLSGVYDNSGITDTLGG